MMTFFEIPQFPDSFSAEIRLPASKSIANRLLVLRFLAGKGLSPKGLSEADDTQLLKSLLEKIRTSKNAVLDCKNAGTTFRFLTSVLSISEGSYVLTGSERMQQRPIKDLVDALVSLGADIQYLGKEGFPPLQINGKPLKGGNLTIKANISSQYVSSLLLIAPFLKEGLCISIEGGISSRPYIEMTCQLLFLCGFQAIFEGNCIKVDARKTESPFLENPFIEKDWSAASYFYAIAALGKDIRFRIDGLTEKSLQGDGRVLPKLFRQFGIETIFTENGIFIQKSKDLTVVETFSYDFSQEPDLAQTFAVVCAALGVKAILTGLHSLRVKETDRIAALATELSKMNVEVQTFDTELHLQASEIQISESTATYGDHRMAMAFAVLAAKFPHVKIQNPEVVEKSFPHFWDELKKCHSPL